MHKNHLNSLKTQTDRQTDRQTDVKAPDRNTKCTKIT